MSKKKTKKQHILLISIFLTGQMSFGRGFQFLEIYLISRFQISNFAISRIFSTASERAPGMCPLFAVCDRLCGWPPRFLINFFSHLTLTFHPENYVPLHNDHTVRGLSEWSIGHCQKVKGSVSVEYSRMVDVSLQRVFAVNK